jgi:hypothetical protein
MMKCSATLEGATRDLLLPSDGRTGAAGSTFISIYGAVETCPISAESERMYMTHARIDGNRPCSGVRARAGSVVDFKGGMGGGRREEISRVGIA